MNIIPAEAGQIEEIMSFYQVMSGVLGEKSFMPDGDKGGFPSREMVEKALREKTLFTGIEDGRLAAAYILNHDCDAAYQTVSWNVEAAADEAVILHALRVLPEYSGRGYFRRLVEHAIQTAKKDGQKAIRLDCIVGNDIPIRVYQSYGFQYVDTREITYANIGIPMPFQLFELALV